MKPLKIEFQAFGPYADYEMVDFEKISSKGLFLICGKTGIGKTMILDAITFSLFGKSSGNVRDDFEGMRCTRAEFDKPTFVRFQFENNGDIYIFERRLERKRKNLSASYSVKKDDGQGHFIELYDNPKEKTLNEKAKELLGLEYEQFRQVIVLPQGQFEKMLTSGSDEKEKILTSIFGESQWQKIAEKFYQNASAKRDALREKRERILGSLKEEGCDTLDELRMIIQGKLEELGALDDEYLKHNYDFVIKEQQDILAIIKRFDDLKQAEDRVNNNASLLEDRKRWEVRKNNAERAARVQVKIDVYNEGQRLLTKREQNVLKAEENLVNSEKNAAAAKERLENHRSKQKEYDKKNEIKISYEGKKSDYENVERAQENYNKLLSEATKQQKKENEIKERYDKDSIILSELIKEHQVLARNHEELVKKYIAGISGELADKLIDGMPCPVCGSTSHPNKTVLQKDSVSKEELDSHKELVEKKYQEGIEFANKLEGCKLDYEEQHKLSEIRKQELIVVESRLKQQQEGFFEGINSIKELEKAIDILKKEIDYFNKKLSEYEMDEKKQAEGLADIRARVETAKEEERSAREELKNKERDIQDSLVANGFSQVEEIKEFLLAEGELNELGRKIVAYDAKVKAEGEHYNQLKQELAGKEKPDKELCDSRLRDALNAKSDYAKNKGILETEITRLNNKFHNIQKEGNNIEEDIRQAEEDWAFSKKLRGEKGTGIQRYVLGVMFTSVIEAANEMLKLVHDGRYYLYRSDEKGQSGAKRGLELKVHDKYSDTHEGRFVNTLSGGEKFLASLALSIGMSTIAQKSGIKIEALFIDEGFGSLDEDSIGDAMDILKSIQKTNGIVGIISHVQLLQDQIPVKLVVEENKNGSHIVQTVG